jgi:hypothetical protein
VEDEGVGGDDDDVNNVGVKGEGGGRGVRE